MNMNQARTQFKFNKRVQPVTKYKELVDEKRPDAPLPHEVIESKSYHIEPVVVPEEDVKQQEEYVEPKGLQLFDQVVIEPVVEKQVEKEASPAKRIVLLDKARTCKCGEALPVDKKKRLVHARLHCRLRGGHVSL
jgi:hypothetical protein